MNAQAIVATDEELDAWGDAPVRLAEGEPPSALPLQYWLYWIEAGWKLPELAEVSNVAAPRLRHFLQATAESRNALAAARAVAADLADEEAERTILQTRDETDPVVSANLHRISEFYQRRARQLAPRTYSERRVDPSAIANAGVTVVLQTFETRPDGTVVAVPLDAAPMVRRLEELPASAMALQASGGAQEPPEDILVGDYHPDEEDASNGLPEPPTGIVNSPPRPEPPFDG